MEPNGVKVVKSVFFSHRRLFIITPISHFQLQLSAAVHFLNGNKSSNCSDKTELGCVFAGNVVSDNVRPPAGLSGLRMSFPRSRHADLA